MNRRNAGEGMCKCCDNNHVISQEELDAYHDGGQPCSQRVCEDR